jgi:hypothetical protein
MSIAGFTPADLALLPALQPADWPPLEQAFAFYLNSPLCRAFVLRRDGVAAATGAVVLFARSAWLGHIITNEHFRRQGLGS